MNRKKVISIVLTGAFVVGGIGVGFAKEKLPVEIIPISAPIEKVISAPVQTNFIDIKDHWSYENITVMEAKGIMTGVDGKFEPEKYVNGTEFTTYLDKIFDFDNDNPIFLEELTTENITRIEVAKSIEKSFEAKKLSVMMTLMFPVYADTINLTPEESSALSFVFNTGVMKGRTRENFHPHEPVTKAELAAVFNRTLNLLEIAQPFEENINEFQDETIIIINGVISEVNLDENSRPKGILVENSDLSMPSFDKIVFLITENTTIIKEDIGTEDLYKGQKVSVGYVDGPVAEIYPVRIEAKTIKILE